MTASATRRLLVMRLLLVLVAGGVATGLAFALRAAFAGRPIDTVRPVVGTEPEPDWSGYRVLTADPVVGFRPKRSIDIEFPMAALDDSLRATIKKHRERHGFLRNDDLPDAITGTRILAVGDSHLDGVVDTDLNLTSLAEVALRADPGGDVWVLNAGCGFYSLYQHALRLRQLAPEWRPRVLLVAVFCGNDFLELDNVKFPHLDDALTECGADPNPPPEDTSRRMKALALPLEAPFWQGMNQALYLHERPERLAPIRAKAERSVQIVDDVARDAGAAVLWVLIPPFDLVFPDKVASASPLANEVVTSGVQRTLYEGFRALLTSRGATLVDLLPPFVADGSLGLYAIDFHIFVRGHRVASEQIVPVLRRMLR